MDLPTPDGMFYLVQGPHGCGKTTALEEAVALSPPGFCFMLFPPRVYAHDLCFGVGIVTRH